MLSHIHVLFAGFTQRWSNPFNGFSGLYYDIWKMYQTEQGTDIHYFPWYILTEDFAKRCAHYHISGDTPKLSISGYSFGGQSAVNLCWAFFHLNWKVPRLCLVDPVRRASYMPWGWLSSLNRYRYFEIPPNVERVDWLWQDQSWPRSHDVRKLDLKTKLSKMRLEVDHGDMDNHDLVRRTIMAHSEYIHT